MNCEPLWQEVYRLFTVERWPKAAIARTLNLPEPTADPIPQIAVNASLLPVWCPLGQNRARPYSSASASRGWMLSCGEGRWRRGRRASPRGRLCGASR